MERNELLDKEEYADIVDDIASELEDKYGAVGSVEIPQPQDAPAKDPPGVGLVFVEFQKAEDAVCPDVLSVLSPRSLLS